MLKLNALANALSSLDEALTLHTGIDDSVLKKAVRDSVIQRFEYSYELAVRLLKRKLQEGLESASEIDRLSFRDLVRVGAERGFVSDPQAWFRFREMRNVTSHAYDDEKAESVFLATPEFLAHGRALLEQLGHA